MSMTILPSKLIKIYKKKWENEYVWHQTPQKLQQLMFLEYV